MPPRLPEKTDFPPNLTLSIIPPPQNKPPVNTLILLHGLGDTESSFAALARQLNLPETACIALRAPSPIPALFTGSDAPSFHWGDDVLFDEGTGMLDLDAGFATSQKVLADVVGGLGSAGFAPRNILFYGYGQGGMAALAYVAAERGSEFGGVVCVGGRLPRGVREAELKCRSPVLVLGGSRSREVTRSAVDALRREFVTVEYVKWAKREDSMPASREEMLPVMKFFARRLGSRAGVPEGAVEV